MKVQYVNYISTKKKVGDLVNFAYSNPNLLSDILRTTGRRTSSLCVIVVGINIS